MTLVDGNSITFLENIYQSIWNSGFRGEIPIREILYPLLKDRRSIRNE